MEPVWLPLAAAWAGLCTASLHAWVALQHRPARDHLWLAVTAAGMACVSFSTWALLQAGAGSVWHRLDFAGGALIVAGFLRFTLAHLRIGAPRLARAADGAALAILAALALRPGALLLGGGGALTSLGAAAVAVLVGLSLGTVALWMREAWIGRGAARTIVPVLVAWLAGGLADTAVALGVLDAPKLMGAGYLPLVLGLSALLTARMARAATVVEELAAQLESRARLRTEELRARDLQLARGEQLAALGTLAAGVAHEINNPLAYVSANLGHLEELWEKERDSDEAVEVLSDCFEGVARVRAIAAGLARMGRGGDARAEPTDLSEIVEGVLPMLAPQARGRAELRTELGDGVRVHGHPHLLGQVVVNLVLNALQAIPPGREEEHRVEVTTARRNGSAVIEVRDTGPGIPPELRERVFEAFFTTKEDGRGTGLGLAVTRQIVGRHGGDVRIGPSETGTCMVVELPLAGEAGARDEDGPAPRAGRTERS